MASNVISRRDLDLTVEDLLVPILLALVIFVLSVLVAGATWYCCRWIWGSGGTPCRDELPLRNVRSWDLHPLSSNPPSTEDNTTVDATITIISPPPNALLHWPLKCQSSGHPFDAEKGVMCPEYNFYTLNSFNPTPPGNHSQIVPSFLVYNLPTNDKESLPPNVG